MNATTALLRRRALEKQINSPETWNLEQREDPPDYDEVDDGGIEYLIKAHNGETIATEE